MAIEKYRGHLATAPEFETPQALASIRKMPETVVRDFSAPAQIERLQSFGHMLSQGDERPVRDRRGVV